MARTRCCWGSFISPLVVSAQGRDDCAFVVRFNGSTVLASKAKPSIARHKGRMDCFVASAFARRRASADKSAPRKKLGLGKAAATIKTVVARLDRAIQYAAAPRSISNASGILGSPGQAGR